MRRQTPMVIDFAPSGAVEAMHRENVLDLGFLGRQEIIRATDIRFDAGTQTWGIWPRKPKAELDREMAENGHHEAEDFVPPPCKEATGFQSYETAREVEIRWLEYCRLVGADPATPRGALVLESFAAKSP